VIVSFSVSNFRSFSAEETFSLVASNRFVGDHENHAVPIPNTREKVLRAGVIYGANGAGKSNLFKALRYLRTMALNPRKKGSGTGREHFRFGDREDKPSVFDLQFIVSDKLYRFGFKVDDQRVVEEWLVWVDGGREKPIYERITDAHGKVTVDTVGEHGEKLKALATIGGPQNQTFLATIRATLDAPDYGEKLAEIFHWIDTGLILVSPEAPFAQLAHLLANNEDFLRFASVFLKSASTGIDHLSATKKELTEEQLRGFLPDDVVSDVLTEIGESAVTVYPLGEGKELLIESTEQNKYYLLTVQASHESGDGQGVKFELADESDGTRRLLNLIPALFHLQNRDAVFFIDEIDRSMHPLLVWEFLDFFLKSCSDGHRQIVVTTHETNLLDLDLLRRDEIWFAEKDQKGATKLYSLADYKVRKDLGIRKHYLQGRFGGVPFLGHVDRLLVEEEVSA
jgi:AAA15 family ATPase/GTPase